MLLWGLSFIFFNILFSLNWRVGCPCFPCWFGRLLLFRQAHFLCRFAFILLFVLLTLFSFVPSSLAHFPCLSGASPFHQVHAKRDDHRSQGDDAERRMVCSHIVWSRARLILVHRNREIESLGFSQPSPTPLRLRTSRKRKATIPPHAGVRLEDRPAGPNCARPGIKVGPSLYEKVLSFLKGLKFHC